MKKSFQIDYPAEHLEISEDYNFSIKYFENKKLARIKPKFNFIEASVKIDYFFEAIAELKNNKLNIELHLSPIFYAIISLSTLIITSLLIKGFIPWYSLIMPAIVVGFVLLKFKFFGDNIKHLIEESKNLQNIEI